MSSQPPGLLFHRHIDRRVDRLAARVRWLDRYRRLMAISAAALIAPVLIAQVAGVLGAEWPQIHATVLSVMLGVIVWWVIEVGLVYVTALWETEHDRLLRERGLPRAVLLRPRIR
jgi:polyferredoxin